MKKIWKNPLVIIIPVSLLVVYLLTLTNNSLLTSILISTFLYIGLSSSWNILSGYTGKLSLGHVAYVGIGAYTSTILLMEYEISPYVGMFLGGLLAALVALVISIPTLKLKGPFFALSTLAVAEILKVIAINWKEVTNGAQGFSIPFNLGPAKMVFEDQNSYIYMMYIYAVVVVLIAFIDHSKIGLYLKAIREGEDAARSLGINSSRYMVFASVLSAFLTGIGGTLFAQYMLLIRPEIVFDTNISMLIVMIAIIGGMGSIYGPVIGAIVMTPISEILSSEIGSTFPGLHLFIYGIVLILIVRFMPEGLYNTIHLKVRKAALQKKKEMNKNVYVEGGA